MAKRVIKPEDILGIECKHITYVKHQFGEQKDMLFVKELIHLKDNTVVPSTRKLVDFKRDFYVTKPGLRKHPNKIQFEEKANLQRYESTQIRLNQAITQALGCGFHHDQRVLARSPYLYGTDATSAVIAKHKYRAKWPDLQTLNSVAVCDLESDVVNGTEEILSGALTYKDRCALYVTKAFLGTIPNPEKAIQEGFEYHLGEVKKKRGITLEVHVVDNEAEVVRGLMATAHEWKPDFLTFWNMAYDVPKMLEALERYHVDPLTVFPDPDIPEEFRHIDWRPGPSMKITASGRTMSLSVAERWNTFVCPASFYFIDAMCVYQKIRIAAGKEPSYALDAILEKHLGIRKLKFKEADGLVGIGWHQFMQSKYKIEYLIYNLFDCISVEMLDEKNMDLASKISLLSGCSEYDRFPSQPRRTCNDLHFFALENNCVIGSTSDQMEHEYDKYVTTTDGWIVTLPAHNIVNNGIRCLEEFPEIATKIRLHVADIDVAAAYPNTEDFLNISTDTTYRELCKVQGMTEWERRAMGINLTGGHVNAAEFCRTLYKMPNFTTLLDRYMQDKHSVGSPQ